VIYDCQSSGKSLGRREQGKKRMQKITPFLWFDGNAEEAVDFYVSIFKKAKKGAVSRYGEAGPGPKDSVMTVEFQIEGQDFIVLNGNPEFKFNESISFVVNCQTQKEVDYYWEKLSKGGKKVACGWLKDKFGVSWQVTPTILMDLIKDKDPAKCDRVMKAMMKMVKIDIEKIKKAAKGK
jgi:predicted 3-demethylubiquinone-9 3-methyltransferase (glyoxalase superfamily)